MEIVLTHNNMDFDSLAAQYAVTKLYPGVRMIPGFPITGTVKDFLSLYRDVLPLSYMKYTDLEHVNHVYIVDCQHANRLDEKARKLLADPKRPITYTIFDHHDADSSGLSKSARKDSIIKNVGATTTLLVEQIIKQKVNITPFEATLFVLGIYDDTGCLSYGGTTAADAECVAYLLKQGADINHVNEFIRPKLNEEQVKLIEKLVASAKTITISGAKAIIAKADWPNYLDGLATIARKLLEIESADATIIIVQMGDRIFVVGRSDSPSLNICTIIKEFGGDGHPGAASAVVKNNNIDQLAESVEQILSKLVEPEKLASEIMSSPVRTIKQRVTMDEAERLLFRYQIDGLVVVEDEHVVGVVSRRDIDQAKHHKLSHAPVLGFMSHPVVTILSETTLSEIQRLMVKEDIGHLPVIDAKGNLVGIVSRKEVMKALYGSEDHDEFTMYGNLLGSERKRVSQVKDHIAKLDASTYWLFEQTGKIAAQSNMVAYAVGGCVRDLLLDMPNFDLDFVVEGSAILLADALQKAFPNKLEVVAKHDRFQTATIIFHDKTKREVDFATARKEFYEFPAALPTVEVSNLKQDLCRRDFTINALAVCLNPDNFGELTDYFGGLNDLKSKTIRILHPFSFIEDPTRIIRAVRFAARLGFSLNAQAKELATRAINMGIFDDLGGFRMRTELQLILESPHRIKSLDLLGKLNARLCYLDSHLQWGPQERTMLRRAERLLLRHPVEESWTIYLGLLISQLDNSRWQAALDRLLLTNEHKEKIARGLMLSKQFGELEESLVSNIKRSEIYNLFCDYSDASLAIAACLAKPGSQWRRKIKLYLDELEQVSINTTGADLLKLGFTEGPQIGQTLNALLAAKLDKHVVSKKDEIAFAQAQLKKASA